MNQPWGLSGPQFLAVYAAALVAALLLGSLIRRQLTRGPRTLDGAPLDLDLYALAALAGGPGRVVETAVHGLLAADALRVSRDHRIAATGTAAADPVQQWVLDRCRASKTMTLSRLRRDARRSTAVSAALGDAAARGLLLTSGRRRGLRLTTLLGLGVFGMGVARVVNGVQLGRPVGFLVFLLVVTVPVLVVNATSVRWTTAAGRRVLAEQQRAWRSQDSDAVAVATASGGSAPGVRTR
ncbi:TIGR04222 domain-containing membrane protein [Streptacidiphilus monticola]